MGTTQMEDAQAKVTEIVEQGNGKIYGDQFGTVAATGGGVALLRLLTLRSALWLECRGLKHSRGSVYVQIKREFGLRGSKANVYTKLDDMIVQAGGVRGQAL